MKNKKKTEAWCAGWVAGWNAQAEMKERTCKPVEIDGVMKCSECDYPLGIMSVPPFCAGCGARVIEDD